MKTKCKLHLAIVRLCRLRILVRRTVDKINRYTSKTTQSVDSIGFVKVSVNPSHAPFRFRSTKKSVGILGIQFIFATNSYRFLKDIR